MSKIILYIYTKREKNPIRKHLQLIESYKVVSREARTSGVFDLKKIHKQENQKKEIKY